MKKVLSIMLFFVVLHNFAQDTLPANTEIQPKSIKNEVRGPHFDIMWRIYYAVPNQFGNHVWHDSYNSRFSLGTSLGVLEYRNFRLTGGFEIEQYDVKDISKAGNFEKISKHSFFGSVSYDYKLSNRFMIVSSIGLGSSDVSHKTLSTRVAHQTGNHIRMGLFCDFSLGNHAAVFLGVHYINSKFDIQINKAYEDYFEKSTQLQLTLGVKVY